MELQARSSNCFLWHVQKRAVHVVLRCDPVLYLMALHGRFQIGLYWLHNLGIWTWLGVLFYCTEGLDWVEEGVCSPFVIGVNRITVCEIFIWYMCLCLYWHIWQIFDIYIYKDTELFGFIFYPHSIHWNLFIKLFYSIFCTVHGI